MIRGLILSGAVLVASAGVSRAQLTPEEAEARLHARQVQEAATTRPADAEELADLHQTVAKLRTENAALKARVSDLEGELKARPVQPAATTKTTNAREKVKIGMTEAEADAILAKYRKHIDVETATGKTITWYNDIPTYRVYIGTTTHYQARTGTREVVIVSLDFQDGKVSAIVH